MSARNAPAPKAHIEKTYRSIRDQLVSLGDEATRVGAARFFKEDQRCVLHGVKAQAVRGVEKRALASTRDMTKDDVFRLCEKLWRSGFLEERSVACGLAYSLREQSLPADFDVFERWVGEYVDNWATCDTLCNHTVGDFVERHPKFIRRLTGWTGADNRWKKRAAAVSLIIPARKGLFLKDIFDIANRLLIDPDDMVQKGYGWMLKAAGEFHPTAVFDYLLSKKEVMPRTAYRYALEKLPAKLREEAMKKDGKTPARNSRC